MDAPPPSCLVLVDDADALADVLAAAHAVSLPIDAKSDAAPLDVHTSAPVVAVSQRAPTLEALLRFARARPLSVVVGPEDERLRAIAEQVSVVYTTSPYVAMSVAALVLRTSYPRLLDKGLSATDRRALAVTAGAGADRLVRGDGGTLRAITASGSVELGRFDDVVAALDALRRMRGPRSGPMPTVEGRDLDAARDVLLGPPRTLSDPASKAALEPYDLPLPVEELCTTASRAASESARLGFPVRLSLASPDLDPRLHDALVVEGVGSPARVRDVFRELTAYVERVHVGARVLGVTVSASTDARIAMRVSMTRIEGTVLAEVGFADPHGRASSDVAWLAFPAGAADVGAALARLRGASLLGGTDAELRRTESQFVDAMFRLAAFLNDFPDAVRRVELDPVALLRSGELEIRGARVEVTDAFERAL